jgi:hypothetical protein
MRFLEAALKMTSQHVSLILVLVGAGLALVGFIHPSDAATRGQMFTFAGGIVTGAFALLRGDSKPDGNTTTQTISTTVPPPAVAAPAEPVAGPNA